MADTIKYVLVALIVGGSMGAFYFFGDHSLLMRVIGLLVAAGVAAALFFQTTVGRQAWGFMGEARTEVRKVVWPTRKETTQTTMVVMGMVVIFAVIMWVFDSILTYLVELLWSQGS